MLTSALQGLGSARCAVSDLESLYSAQPFRHHIEHHISHPLTSLLYHVRNP